MTAAAAAAPAPASDPRDRQITGMASLLLLMKRAREAADVEDLGFVLVNDTAVIAPVQSAFFCRPRHGRLRVAAVSGVPAPSREAPFTLWCERLCRDLTARFPKEPAVLTAADVPPAIGAEWGDMLAAHALWLPLAAGGPVQGGLLLARAEAWREEEVRLLRHWSDAAGHALDRLVSRRRFVPKPAGAARIRRALGAAALVAAVAVQWLPVRLSALAPAEVVAHDPEVVRAPLDGVIDAVLVQPNAAVAAGQTLFRLDDTELRTRLGVVQQGLEIALAEHRQAQQGAVTNQDSKTLLPILRNRIEQRRAEVAHVETLLQRIAVPAEKAGIVMIADASTLRGRPVRLGERIMTVAEPDDVELEIWLPVGDSIVLPPDAPVDLFLNIDPERAIHGRVRLANYQATTSPDGMLAFRLVARFDGGQPLPRLGLRGTAKVHGDTVPLYHYLFRRPVAALRQWIGV